MSGKTVVQCFYCFEEIEVAKSVAEPEKNLIFLCFYIYIGQGKMW